VERPAFTLNALLLLSILALLANACYCVAYVVDIPMQSLFVGDARRRYRWLLWLERSLPLFSKIIGSLTKSILLCASNGAPYRR
jgi:hypothetical protein